MLLDIIGLQALRKAPPRRPPAVVRNQHKTLGLPPDFDVCVCGGTLGLFIGLALQVWPKKCSVVSIRLPTSEGINPYRFTLACKGFIPSVYIMPEVHVSLKSVHGQRRSPTLIHKQHGIFFYIPWLWQHAVHVIAPISQSLANGAPEIHRNIHIACAKPTLL